MRTLAGLDYELSRVHHLVVGTEEARLAGPELQPGTTANITVTVLDRNDVAPVWTRLPPSNNIQVRITVNAANVFILSEHTDL